MAGNRELRIVAIAGTTDLALVLCLAIAETKLCVCFSFRQNPALNPGLNPVLPAVRAVMSDSQLATAGQIARLQTASTRGR